MKAMRVLLIGLLLCGCVESTPQPGHEDSADSAVAEAETRSDHIAVDTIDAVDTTPPDTCTPVCEDGPFECGDDGCGGSCGECPFPQSCEDGSCAEPVPGEFGASCLADEDCESGWCIQMWDGGRCTHLCIEDCPGPLDCTLFDWVEEGFGLCAPSCEPDCDQKVCGWDGCSGVCGLCPLIQDVCTDGLCVCIPDCEDKECCSDGCGGSCGSCSWPFVCEDHQCVCDYSEFPEIPVCDWANLVTYSDGCEAVVAGIDDYGLGACPMDCVQALCEESDFLSGTICGLRPSGNSEQTYGNLCALKCNEPYPTGNEDCLSLEDCPDIVHVGTCWKDIDYCIGTGCPANYDPVCGMNGQTFWNYCCFDMIAVPDGVEYFCQGECIDPATCPDAPMICDPVCALKGIGLPFSYINAEIRDCLLATPLYDAPCCVGVSLQEDWVCAEMDGTLEAFLNDDVLMCTDLGTPVLYEIPQDAYGDYQLSVCDDCQCDLSETDEGTWLCGSDFTTYLNQCALSCFADPPSLPATALCESGCGFMTDECPCPPGVGGSVDADTPSAPGDTGARGVCGDDGTTYGSACDAAYNGVPVSDDTWCPECEDLCKGVAYEPLCCKLPGQDTGATYPNLCVVQNCSMAYEAGDCANGACCLEDSDCDDGDPDIADLCTPMFVCEHI